jgi:uridine phosphorylase
VTNDNAIVNPQRPKISSDLGAIAVMVATPADLSYLCEILHIREDGFRRLFISRLYLNPLPSGGFTLVGPFIGAPYAAMLLEILIAWGARKIIFVGWCGAVSAKARIGDIIIPTSAVIDEGTSRHYNASKNDSSAASASMVAMIGRLLTAKQIVFHAGAVWSTDGVYRETREKVETFQRAGVLAVEMEISALFSVARFRGVELGGILVVSDELSSFVWQPGFKDDRFIAGRHTACQMVKELCQGI